MKAAWYSRNGTAHEVLSVGEIPTPAPGPGEVRVQLHASGVNPSDVKSRARRPLESPFVIPHSDGAGIIDAVGDGVAPSRVGQRVWVWNAQWQRAMGTAAEWVCLPSAQAVALPERTSFDEGACLGIPLLTALQALRLAGQVQGRTLLVTGAGSVVGHYITQIAVRSGATVIGTAGSAPRAAHARAAGAAHVVDYKTEPVAERVRELTHGQGVDAVLDMDFSSSAALIGQRALRPHGRIVSYGANQTGNIPIDFRTMLWDSLKLDCFLVYELLAADREAVIAQAHELLAQQALTHTIAASYALADIAQAHELVEAGSRLGVVLVRP